MRIRFTKHEDTEPAPNISYRRVSEASTKRSRERAARQSDAANTRRNQAVETTVENPRSSDGHDLDLSETGPLALFMSPERVLKSVICCLGQSVQ